MEIDPVFLRASQGAVAIVFGAAAVSKLVNIDRFKRALASYGLVPAFLLAPLALALAIGELAVAVALPLEAARYAAALAGFALIGVFFTAMAVNLARGNRDIDCGCWAFGKHEDGTSARLSGWHLGRAALLALLLAPSLMESTQRTVEWVDYFTVAGSLAIAGGMFFAIDLLLANGVAVQKLRS
ncbi:MauE/DoxX family redox-associated membrane protein [Cupriavidus pinatubonensis]|uniref:MauE/DoxX family redox-associated membrane protein n=1 Tax=Cupriavidus pinatubonensis TaxID=248026 RepID=UPI00112D359D|nr:MauE/DoxX family redox-associated membrane protein [Cupriavidus pinatubonensis]TPQ37843.1 hypothetical protein C2U69_15315 [Cupriavidus pinatubonensis]